MIYRNLTLRRLPKHCLGNKEAVMKNKEIHKETKEVAHYGAEIQQHMTGIFPGRKERVFLKSLWEIFL